MRASALSLGVGTVILAMLTALLATTALLLMLLSRAAIAVSVLGTLAFVAALLLSGNPRLFCLWGLLMTAPLNLSLHFHIIGHMGGASAYTIDAIDIFIAALLAFQFRDHLQGHRPGWRLSPITFYCGSLIGLGILAALLGPYRSSALQETLRLAKCLLLCVVLINELVRVKQFHHVFLALLIGVSIEAVIGLVQYFTNRNLGLQVLGEAQPEYVKMLSAATLQGGAWVYRVGALLGHANLLAAYLAMLLPIGIALLFTRIDLRCRFVCAAAVLLGVAALVATLSRSGWITFATALGGLLVLTFLHPRMRNHFMLTRVGLMGAIALVCLTFSGPIMDRLLRSDPNAVRVRWEYLGIAWKMIGAKPILGFGLNSYVFNMAPYSKYGTPAGLTQAFGQDWPVVHNIYALTWVEQGTIGFLIFLLMHLYVLRVAFRNLRVKDDVLYAIGMGALCGFVAIMLDGLASFSIRLPGVGRIYWILIALILAIDYWGRVNSTPLCGVLTPQNAGGTAPVAPTPGS